jgi:hypothetical protein
LSLAAGKQLRVGAHGITEHHAHPFAEHPQALQLLPLGGLLAGFDHGVQLGIAIMLGHCSACRAQVHNHSLMRRPLLGANTRPICTFHGLPAPGQPTGDQQQ